jgi:hypothetical protein
MIDVQRPEFMTGFMSKRQIHNLYAPWSKSYRFAQATRLRLRIKLGEGEQETSVSWPRTACSAPYTLQLCASWSRSAGSRCGRRD